jgi:hypothetical protein
MKRCGGGYVLTLVFAVLLFLVVGVGPASAGPISLWIGNDLNPSLSVLETTLSGTVLRTVSGVDSIGFAIDQQAGLVYFNDGFSITPMDLVTLTAGTPLLVPGMLDMTFDGAHIWAANPFNYSLDAINPADGSLVTRVDLGYQPLGVTWTGDGFFWVSENGDFATGVLGTPVRRYTTAGVFTGQMFTPWPAVFVGDELIDPGRTPGGLAYTGGTLWIGDTEGWVRHYATDGTPLAGDFTTGDGRYVGGLEAPIPEPSTTLLLGGGLLALLAAWRRRAS